MGYDHMPHVLPEVDATGRSFTLEEHVLLPSVGMQSSHHDWQILAADSNMHNMEVSEEVVERLNKS